MAETARLKNSISGSEVAAFRLTRHHLLGETQADLLTVCRDVCGIQAQVMSSAQTALWARMRDLTPPHISSALWENRTLVKTACMRGTLHLLTATDFPIYIAALKASRVRQLLAIVARYGVKEREAREVTDAAMEALGPGPMARRALIERVLSKVKVGKQARVWFEQSSWSVARLAITEGLVCYGPDCGREVSMVRTDRWLPKQAEVSEQDAQGILLRRYLSAYGPATCQDFAKWAGLSMPESKATAESLKEELIDIVIEKKNALILRKDFDELRHATLDEMNLRLLPGFDPYLLAHADKNHLVSSIHYKRVYRNQWWISNVVVLNGTVIGTWSYARRGKRWLLEIQPFVNFSTRIRKKIEEEAASLGRFFQTSWEIKFGT